MAEHTKSRIRHQIPKAPDEFIAGLLALDEVWQVGEEAAKQRLLTLSEEESGLLAVSTGKCVVRSAGWSGPVEAGAVLLLRGPGPVTLETGDECTWTWLSFRGEVPHRIWEALECAAVHFADGACQVEAVGKAVLEGAEESAAAVSARLYALLMTLYEKAPRPEPSGHSLLVEGALEVLERDFAFLTGVEDLAARMEVSREHLVRSFHREVGVPPGKYLNLRKLEYAKQLLRDTDQSVSFVAQASGFVSPNYFIRVFRKATGMTPGAFRRSVGRTGGGAENLPDEYYVL